MLFGVFALSPAWADVKLPEPKKEGGEAIFALLERRASGGRNNFPSGDISIDDLSSILWSATGRNRGGSGWTVPLAGGREPYVDIYAVKSDGVFRYDWKDHSLAEISDKDVRTGISGDGFVQNSACVLVFVTAAEGLGSMARLNEGNALAYIATGAMSQNIYLAADSLGISTRYMVSMKLDGVKKELKLGGSAEPLCILPLGGR
jgi:nitroreductase